MSKKLSAILALLLVGTFLWMSLPVQAQPVTTLADTRERVNGILVQLRTFDNLCVIILGGQLKEVDIDILAARRLITVGKGNLTNLLLDYIRSAQFGIARVMDTIEQCQELLGTQVEPGSASLRVIPAFNQLLPQQQEESDGTIVGEVEEVVNEVEAHLGDEGLAPRKANKVLSLLNNIVLPNLECIEDRLGEDGSITTEVQSRSAEIDEISSDIANPVSELVVALNAMRVLPELTETGPIPFEVLRELKIGLGRTHQALVQILRGVKRITVCKKWVFKAVREVYELLRASNFGGRAAGELGESITQVYALDGRLIIRQMDNSLSTAGLSNGVYLIVKKIIDKTGKVRYETQKLVVAR
jgi:hypothetical protein